MQEFVNEAEMEKTYKERLDELIVGGSIPLDDDKEKDKFSATMYRDFHSVDENTKLFSIRTNKKTKKRRLWRLK